MAGNEDEVGDAVAETMGVSEALRSWARIKDERYSTAIATVKVGVRELTPAEEGQVGEVPRLARAALAAQAADPLRPREGGLPLAESLGGVLGAGGAAPPEVRPDAILGSAKIKLATFLDQGDDSEIKPLGVDELCRLVDTWIVGANDGEEPTEEEEATGDQIAALNFRLRAGGTSRPPGSSSARSCPGRPPSPSCSARGGSSPSPWRS